MKQFLLKTCLMLVCLLVGAGTTWADSITKSISDVVTENSYTVSSGTTINTKCTSIDLDANINVTVNVKDGATGNTGTFWGTSPNIDWRLYQGDEPTITVTASTGYTISTVKFTYSNSNTGVINTSGHGQSIASGYQIKSGTDYEVNAASATYYVGNTSTKTNGQARITAIEVVYTDGSTPEPTKYTVSIANNIANGSVTASPTSATAGTTITLTATPADGYNFGSWNVTGATVANATLAKTSFTMPESDVTVSATFEKVQTVDPGEGSNTGTIVFGTNKVKIDKANATGTDNLGNVWTITTEGTTSFTANADYYQVGSGSKPATSITFTTTLPDNVTVTSFSAKFGGFSGTAGTVDLKVGDNTVGTGSLNATNDVTIASTSAAEGKVLTVTVTGIAKGVKAYNITYSYVTDGGGDDGGGTIEPPVGETKVYVKKDISQIKADDEVIVTMTNATATYAMTNNKGLNTTPAAIAVTVTDDKVETNNETLLWYIVKNNDGTFSIYKNGTTDKYLFCKNATNIGVGSTTNPAKDFTVEGNYLCTTQTTNPRYIGVYQNKEFRAYTSSDDSNIAGQTLAFYVYSTGEDSYPEIPNFIKTSTLTLEVGAAPYDVRQCLNLPDEYKSEPYKITTTIDGLTQKDGEYACVYPWLSFTKAGTYTVIVTAAAIDGKYSETVGKITVKVNNPTQSLTTIDEIFAAATATGSTATPATVTFNNWVVSGVKGSNAYVTDNAGKGFIIYSNSHGFEVGDVLSGTAECQVQLYNGSAELTKLTSTTFGLIVTKGGTVTPVTNIALEDLSGINTGAVVTYNGLTYEDTNFTDGTTAIKPYGTFMTLPQLIEGKIYNVTGVYIQFKETKEIAPRTEADIVLVEALNSYLVNIVTPENGTLVVKNGETVINDGDRVEEGTKLTIECTPASADYRFKNWQYKAGDESWATRYNATQDYTMPSTNVQFRANFELIPVYAITWSINGVETHTTIKDGETLEVSEVDDIDGHKFMGWTNAAIEGTQSEAPIYVSPVAANATYYAVFATASGSGDGEATYELTQDQIAAAYVGSGDGKTTSYGNYEFGDGWSGSCIINLFNGTYFVQIRKNVANNYILTPEFPKGVTSITINTTALNSSATGSTALNRTFYLCASNETAQPTSGDYGSGALAEENGSVTIPVNGNPKQFYIYSNGGAYIKSISVTCGAAATYTDYCTLIGEAPASAEHTLTLIAQDTNGDYYATFSSDKDVIFLANQLAEVQTVFTDGEDLLLETLSDESWAMVEGVESTESYGYYVPANTGVLISSGETTVKYYDVTEYEYNQNESDFSDNMLVAASVPMTGDYLFYKLAYGDYEAKTDLGFYWGKKDGAAFTCKAGTAYLAVPTSAASNLRGFVLGGDTLTGIKDAAINGQNTEIFNLQGQRISRLQQGVNIVNGKKVIR